MAMISSRNNSSNKNNAVVLLLLFCTLLLPLAILVAGVQALVVPQPDSLSHYSHSRMNSRHHHHHHHHHHQRMRSITALLPSSSSSSSSRPARLARSTTASPSATKLHAIIDIVGVSPEPIHTAFNIATFGPQPFWLLLILFPKSDLTKKMMGTMDVVLFFAVVHFMIVSSSILDPSSGTAPIADFNDVFDPSGDPQKAFMKMVTNFPNFVAEEWSHVLTWDLFVGRWIWLDGLKRNIFTAHSILFCNLIGPPGLLLHGITSAIFGDDSFLGYNEVDDIIITNGSTDETEEQN